MSFTIVTATLGRSLARRSLQTPSLTAPSLRRAASLNSAISRGLRKSKAVGFRGKEKFQETNGNHYETRSHTSPVRRTADPVAVNTGPKLTRGGWRIEAEKLRTQEQGVRRSKEPNSQVRSDKRERLERSTPRLRVGKRVIKDERPRPSRARGATGFREPNVGFGETAYTKRATPQSDREPSSANQRAIESDRMALLRDPNNTNLSVSRQAFLARVAGGTSAKYDKSSSITKALSLNETSADVENSQSRSERQGRRIRSNHTDSLESRKVWSPREHKGSERYMDDNPGSHHSKGQRSSAYLNDFTSHHRRDDMGTESAASRPAPKMDSRLPLSIPYTTPASEFLYGTSVVQAALRSHRRPRRQLYKLYIYTGENRDHIERDVDIERFAKKIHVETVRVGNEWLRLMDKMSAGRPHNGYILEASPLPKLPVTSLGELTSQNDEPGFTVGVDHQSREEASINGTSNFIPVLSDAQGRKPFVLFLDSILDPGNLGGIIRTASFLGVTAIAISSRNCATFTPVVLKASAGASENITIFSVNKPAGFIADSKLAGWKVYAAVAPSRKHDSSSPVQVSSDDLDNPLEHDPCILMLGNEGEGLRWNLRSKADTELAIRGSGQRGGVDSLNVSVATGILCNAFLSGGRATRPHPPRVSEKTEAKRDLF
ncbi:MAG: hypothetical protein M1818_004457 [Claussenomyces sp. TS43310]|nr:MAG: hypothetical protein M1818_004457 [Claussenomyces sp. TS43310]